MKLRDIVIPLIVIGLMYIIAIDPSVPPELFWRNMKMITFIGVPAVLLTNYAMIKMGC
jgi:hypothetical protein